MESSNEDKRTGPPGSEDELAKDVARLYSWANVEDAAYRNFSRQRKHPAAAATHPADNSASQGHESEALESLPAEALATPVISLPTVAKAVPAVPEEARPGFPAIPESREHSAPVQAVPVPLGTAHPVMAIYSLAGGVGKTTLAANLGRIFCSMGERILLVDASGSGLLPFYFGAADLRAGLRTFEASGVNFPPIQVIGADEVTAEWLEDEVKPVMERAQRTIFDMGPASMGVSPEIFAMCSIVLVPLLSDWNSIFTVTRIEASLQNMQSKGIKAPTAYYIFNRFDEGNPMDQQARELVQRQCGDRLLPMAIQQSSAVAEAIAARMTVADHAPQSEVAGDYLELAEWLRKIAPSSPAVQFTGRWSER